MKNHITYSILLAVILSVLLFPGCGSDSEHQPNSTQTENHDEHGNQSPQHADSSHTNHNEAEGGQSVKLSKQQRQNLDIQISELNAGNAASAISRPATITYDLDNIAKVGPRIEAKVIRVRKDLGDRVRVGEPLALMSSIQLGQTKAEYIRLKAKLKSAEARYEREQSLYEQEISSQAELLDAEAVYQQARAELNATSEALRLYGLSEESIQQIETGSDQPLSRFYINSPINGVVQERDLSPGQTVSPSQTPMHIANLSEMWVMIDAYEQDIQYIEQGQSVTISVRSIAGKTFQGQVDWISYALAEDSRTMPVRAVMNNPDRQLRAGMFGTARIQTDQQHSVAMIPVDAVQAIDGQDKVFIPGDETGHFRTVDVMLGMESEGMVEIASGLQPGDRAVTAGAFDLKSALTAQSRSAAHSH